MSSYFIGLFAAEMELPLSQTLKATEAVIKNTLNDQRKHHLLSHSLLVNILARKTSEWHHTVA